MSIICTVCMIYLFFRFGKENVESISKLVFTSDEFRDLHNSVDALKAHFRKIVSSI